MQLRIGLLFTGKYFTGVVEVLEIKRATNELEVKCKSAEQSSDYWWFETWDLAVTERGFHTGDYFISPELAKMNDLTDPLMKPSLFLRKPLGSITGKSEKEIIAHNIMAILSRTGDKFRDLSWEEYKIEREKDGKFSEQEEKYFNEMKYLSKGSVRQVTVFCSDWKNAYWNAQRNLQKNES